MVCNLSEDNRVGFAFDNPDLVSHNGWGNACTPDELRGVYAFGASLVAPDGQTITDETLQWYIDNAMGHLERDLEIDLLLKKRRYKEYVINQGRVYDDISFSNSGAIFTGCADLSAGLTFTEDQSFRMAIDNGNYFVVTFPVSAGVFPAIRTAAQIVSLMNQQIQAATGLVNVATLISNRDGTQFVQLKSPTTMAQSAIEFIQPLSGSGCIDTVLGLRKKTTYHYNFHGWIPEQDFFWEEPYDFDRKQFNNYILIKLKHRPLVKLYRADFRDIAGGLVANIFDWAKPNYEKGSIEFFPHTGALASLPLYAGASFPLAQSYQAIQNYPDGFFLDYDSGFPTVIELRKKWPELIAIIGKLAAINLLREYGDGRTGMTAGGSIGLAGLSESYTTTQSAGTLLYQARINSYIEELKEFYAENKRKYAGIFLGQL